MDPPADAAETCAVTLSIFVRLTGSKAIQSPLPIAPTRLPVSAPSWFSTVTPEEAEKNSACLCLGWITVMSRPVSEGCPFAPLSV